MDLAWPLVFCLRFGLCLLLTGKWFHSFDKDIVRESARPHLVTPAKTTISKYTTSTPVTESLG
ncbi:unnamed protein product [Laminaria digitata]